MISFVIPSINDPYLENTVYEIHTKSRGDVEIIPVTEGAGMRDKINEGVAQSSGEYIAKCDAHCMFDEGFDIKLLEHIEDHWVVTAPKYDLNPVEWKRMDGDPIDHWCLNIHEGIIRGCRWGSKSQKYSHIPVAEIPIFQGSFYLMSRKHWDWLGGLQVEGYGQFGQEATEICFKTWLSGKGKVMVNKNTWYAHKYRKFPRTYRGANALRAQADEYAFDYWINNKWDKAIHDVRWLKRRCS